MEFLFRSPTRHGYGAAFRSSVFSRALGRRGSACRGADRSRDYRVARAADEAVKRRPGRIVTLRQKTRLLADSRRQ